MINDFGSLGTVEIQTWQKPDFEVFAKVEGSPINTRGADFSDDNAGPLDPTLAIE